MTIMDPRLVRPEFRDTFEKLRLPMRFGARPIIVLGAGVSAGALAPTMDTIHRYLHDRVSQDASFLASPEGRTIAALLKVLLADDDSTIHPRSASVRLYHLLQSSRAAHVRATWSAFGVDLLAGRLCDEGGPLWGLNPTRMHEIVASLSVKAKAIVVSLNFDGLTKHAIDRHHLNGIGKKVQKTTGCILGSAEEIRAFFGGSDGTNRRDAVAPVVKFRGDVFHAVCSEGRCSETGKELPLYDLLRNEKSSAAFGQGAVDNLEKAKQALLCPGCQCSRNLRISFPGVYGKEQEIQESLTAVHQLVGSRIGGVIFIGCSGKWDEALIEYLIRRAVRLGVPVLSASKSPTPAIERVCGRYEYERMYAYTEYVSRSSKQAGQGEEFERLLETMALTGTPGETEGLEPSGETSLPETWHFPTEALQSIGRASENGVYTLDVRLPGSRASGETVTSKRVTIQQSGTSDSIAGVANEAILVKSLNQLKNVSQLGLKSALLGESSGVPHTRLHHSAAVAALAGLWHVALTRLAPSRNAWEWSREARVALVLASLYHDARHLPFSHMMEEVFEELNWGVYDRLDAFVVRQGKRDTTPRGNDESLWEAISREVESDEFRRSPRQFWAVVQSLQDGRLGVPWLEAIVDSAIDVDKIEYIFHDTRLTGQAVRLPPITTWLEEFFGGQSTTHEGLIRLEGSAAEATLALLEERQYLYRRLYLAPELRSLEAIARFVLITWLEWKVPERLDLGRDACKGLDLRQQKAEAAQEILWEKSREPAKPPIELNGIVDMCDELASGDYLDPSAIDWIRAVREVLSRFLPSAEVDEGSTSGPSLVRARVAYQALAPIGPFYIHQLHRESLQRIVRRLRTQFPVTAIVDVARLPTFLATPRHRWAEGLGSFTAVAEQFLVPSARPNEWKAGRAARTPLHTCEFSGLELPACQVIVVDPLGAGNGGASFVFQMLCRELEAQGIKKFDSPEEVANERI